jgi:23S rRNA pseudouridine1911/1915/1917 synthase
MIFSGVQPKVLSMGSGVVQATVSTLKSTDRKAAKILFVMTSLHTHKTNPDYTDGTEPSAPEVSSLDISALAGAGLRLDKFLALQLADVSRTRIQKWIALGAVRVNGLVVHSKYKLNGLESVEVDVLPVEADTSFEPDDVALAFVAQNADFVVINKAPNQVVHPGHGHWRNTLMNGLLFHFPDSAFLPRAGIVHRLDKDTSGLMVVARNDAMRAYLMDLLSRHEVERTYWALAWGAIVPTGKIDQPLGRDPHNRLKMAIVQSGKKSVSHFKLLADGNLMGKPVSLIEVKLETGRTHQIRVHFQSIGHPLVGDVTYVAGAPMQAALQVAKTFNRQALHAKKLGFVNSRNAVFDTGKPVRYESELPEDFSNLLVLAGIRIESLAA